MQNIENKQIKFLFLVLFIFCALGLYLIFYVLDKKYELESKKAQETGLFPSGFIQEERAQRLGWMRSFSGEVVSSENDQLRIKRAVDPNEPDVEYVIEINDKTKAYRGEIVVTGSGDKEEMESVSEVQQVIPTSEIKKGQMIEVFFAKRMDVDGGQALLADEILVYSSIN